MDYKTQDAILREAEKLTDDFIQIVCKESEPDLYAVAYKDGRGQVIDYMTEFLTPSKLLADLRDAVEYQEEINRMFKDF